MVKKILIGVAATAVVFLVSMVIYVQIAWDKVYDIPYPDLKTTTDPEVIEYGKYLVHGPAHCSNCHVSSFDNMILADQGEDIPLVGGVRFPMGPLGSLSPANLTPHPENGIGRYTDGELFRMMRHAVKPDGVASVALMMPFWNMADEDLIAVVSYLRSLEPVSNVIEPPSWTFMGKAVRVLTPTIKPIFNPTPPDHAPPMKATVERGEYISRYVANCVGCHTPRDPMTFEAIGPEYSGGMEMEPMVELNVKMGLPENMWTRSPNITPHPDSHLSNFKSLEEWTARFRNGRVISISPMHWGPFSRMTDEDLEALWLYLNSLEPVEHDIGPVMFVKD